MLYGSRPEDDRSPLETQENVLPFLSGCASIAPTYLSLGNHEWMVDEADIKEIEKTGVTVLDNSWVEMDGVILAGLTSGYVTGYRAFRAESGSSDRYPRREDLYGIGGVKTEHKPSLSWLEEYCASSGYHILLSHHPEYWPALRDMNIDLVLSGHTHGGQWRVYNPFKKDWIGIYAPGQGFWPRWTRGVYEEHLIVSAGLSNTTWIPRLFNPTEVVYIEP